MAYIRKCRWCEKDIYALWNVRYDTKYEVKDYYHYDCHNYMRRHKIPLDRRRTKYESCSTKES